MGLNASYEIIRCVETKCAYFDQCDIMLLTANDEIKSSSMLHRGTINSFHNSSGNIRALPMNEMD